MQKLGATMAMVSGTEENPFKITVSVDIMIVNNKKVIKVLRYGGR